MAMLCTVMAWGETRTAGTYAELQDAIAASAAGDVIELTADIAYPASPTRSDLINIDKSITLDGKGHKITGYGYCNYRLDDKATFQPTHIAINANHDKSGLNVTIKNLKLDKNVKKYALNGQGEQAVTGCPSSSDRYYGIGVFDGVTRLTLEKDTFTTTVGGNSQVVCATGTSSTPLKLVMNQVKIDATLGSGYATYFLKPIDLEMNDCYLKGFCALYFKPNLEPFSISNYPRKFWYGIDNYGSKGSVAVLNNCTLDSKNPHSTTTNDFGVLAMEEGDINITLNNCDLDAQSLGSCDQALFLLSDWAPLVNRNSNNVLTITGENSHINGDLVNAVWYALVVNEGEHDLYENGYNDGTKTKQCEPFSAFEGDIQVIISGGTYNFDPREYKFDMHVSPDDPHYADGAAAPTVFTKKGITIPAGRTVQEVTVDGVKLYRVIEEIQTSYNINQDVPEEEGGAGENPNTNFIVQETTTLDNNETEANYILVKEEGGNETTLTVGKEDADQTLTVSKGIDVQDEAQVIVKSGSALVVEGGGVITSKPENIVIEANENGAASLLLSPAVTVNQTPNLTVKMTVPAGIHPETNEDVWHRFAMPVQQLTSAWTKKHGYETWLYGWNYEANDWALVSGGSTGMEPWRGYTLSYNNTGEEVYTFKGKLVGNTDAALNFVHEGYNFFGNSYTGYIDAKTLVEGLVDSHIDGTVYMWDAENQNYGSVTLNRLRNDSHLEDWEKEVAPMQTFILRIVGANSAAEEVKYADAIWGNPRYGKGGNNSAPRRRKMPQIGQDDAYFQMVVTAANGKSDRIIFTENAANSNDFESGFDADKFMNEKSLNIYSTINGENYSTIATDNLEGMTISMQTKNAVNYTISFKYVEGNEYALLDKATDQLITIEEGATYEFSAQPNSTIEGRFQIVERNNMPTAIENTEVKAKVKGIYSITGMYLGEDFEALPAGVYVVDGVKIVK